MRRMLRELDSRELSDWQRYYAIEPWGFPMENARAGTIATEVARPNWPRYSLPKPGDWFKESKGPVGQSKDDMKAEMNAAAKRFNAARGKK